MSGETENNVSGWSVDTLKAHFDQRFADQEKATDKALAAAEKAVTKAEGASEKRFESVNEFRAALSDASKDNISRTEHDATVGSLREKVIEQATRLDRIEAAKQGGDESVTHRQAFTRNLVGVLAFAASIVFGAAGIAIALIVKG